MSASRMATKLTSGRSSPLSEKVDADDDVVDPEAQVSQDFGALQGLDLRVEVVDPDSHLLKVVGQLLGHTLGEGRYQASLFPLHPGLYLLQEVVDLTPGGLDGDGGVQEAGGPDHLLHHLLAHLHFVGDPGWRIRRPPGLRGLQTRGS